MPPIGASWSIRSSRWVCSITNGQFVAFDGENPIEIVINPTCDRLGPASELRLLGAGGAERRLPRQELRLALRTATSAAVDPTIPARPSSRRTGASSRSRGCSFATAEPSVLLGKGLKHAIVTGNNGIKGVTDHQPDRRQGDHRQQRAGRAAMRAARSFCFA